MKSRIAFCRGGYRSVLIIAILALGALSACKDEGLTPGAAQDAAQIVNSSGNGSNTQTPAFVLSPNEAQLKISMHDKPIAGKEVEKVFIEIQSVSVLDQAGSEIVLSQEIQKFDLYSN